MNKYIGLYPDAFQTTNPEKTTVETFLTDIQTGRWQDPILKIRAMHQQGKSIKEAKKKLPLVTGSGMFTVRNNDGLEKHSGFLLVDLDAATLKGRHKEFKEALSQDPLFYALFYSCSGEGICGFVKISPKAHLESFNYMSEHLFLKYALNMDEKCKDVCRPRFVSYDPDLYLNEESQLSPFNPILKKDRVKPPKYHFVDEDFKRIIADINTKQLDLTEDYNDWIKCGFALVDKFDEAGREYFHEISQHNAGYDVDRTDTKYDHLLKSKDSDITIDWFYYVVEKNGLQAYGKATRDFLQESLAEQRAYDAGLTDTRPLGANLVGLKIESTDVGIQIRDFLRKAYRIVKNEMTGAIEVNGEVLDDELLNTIYLLCRSVIDKISSREIVYQVMDSRFTRKHHPFKEYMAKYDDNLPVPLYGYIDALIATLDTDTPNVGLYVKKWLVSIIGSMYGKHSPLMLILQGPQNCGKTEWFRRLLPAALADNYYAESKLDEGKDDMILMSKKILIVDDELSGKSKQEQNKLKSTLSRQKLDLRVPFGRTATTLNRIAVLGATTNDDEIQVLNDPTGNRRMLPVGIKGVDYEAYNLIDKGCLFYELYLEYMNGYNYEMTNDEIALLAESSEKFKPSVPEEELIMKYLALPATGSHTEEMTCSDVYDYIKSNTRLNINNNTIGKYMKKLGFQQKHRKVGKSTARKYVVVKIDPNEDFSDFL